MTDIQKHIIVVLKNTNDILGLRKFGYEFDEILNAVKELIEIGFVIRTEEKIILSEKGIEEFKLLDTGEKFIRKGEPTNWIIPDYRYQLSKSMKKTDLFIPSKNYLNGIIKKVKESI